MRDQEIFYKQHTLYKWTGQVIKSVLREQTLNESSQKLTLIQRKRTIRHKKWCNFTVPLFLLQMLFQGYSVFPVTQIFTISLAMVIS
jgi:hypothetical protein